MNIDNVTIGEGKQLAAMFGGCGSKNRLASDGDIRIAVLQRGHIVVGKYFQSGDIGELKQAAVVRRWGTTEGLGELAQKGPLENTKLDKCPNVSFHIREVVFLMEVDLNAWGKHLN